MIESEVEAIGVLKNAVVDEPGQSPSIPKADRHGDHREHREKAKHNAGRVHRDAPPVNSVSSAAKGFVFYLFLGGLISLI